MKSQSTSFGDTVVHSLSECHKARYTRNRDDMTVVALEHGWEKLLDCPEMRKNIDIKSAADIVFAFLEDSAILSNTGVVDEHGRIAVLETDEIGGGFQTR